MPLNLDLRRAELLDRCSFLRVVGTTSAALRRFALQILAFWATVVAAMVAFAPVEAADIRTPVPKAPPASAPAYNWSGFYVGANAGYGSSKDSSFNLAGANGSGSTAVDLFPPAAGSFNTGSGLIGGGQLGYNWQLNAHWMAGLETDINFFNRGSGTSFPEVDPLNGLTLQADASRRLTWLGTVRGRLGVLPNERLLIFATGGLAYGEDTVNASLTNTSGGGIIFSSRNGDGTSALCPPAATCFGGSSARTSAGWAVGGGVEYALWNSVSLKAEYLYVALRGQTIDLSPVPPATGNGAVAANVSYAGYQIVRVGINFKFDGLAMARH